MRTKRRNSRTLSDTGMHTLVLVAKEKVRIWRLTSLIMMLRNLHISRLYPTNRKPYDEFGQGFRSGLCYTYLFEWISSDEFPAGSSELYLQRYDSV